MSREEEIRLIAYDIWKEEGRIHGRDVEHWLKAEAFGRKGESVRLGGGFYFLLLLPCISV